MCKNTTIDMSKVNWLKAISVSVKQPSAIAEPYEQYASPCEKINRNLYTVRYTLPQPQTTTAYVKPTTGRLRLPEDQPINDSSVGGEPEGMTKHVLYVFIYI